MEKNTAKEAGRKMGWDEMYENEGKLERAVNYRFQKVKKNPAQYDVDPEKYAKVVTEVGSRAVASHTPKKDMQEMVEDDPRDVLEMLSDIKKKGIHLAEKKLERLATTKKQLDKTKLRDFSTFIGTIIDKHQLLAGKATENVAVRAEIKEDMDPDEALSTMLRMREENMEGKDRTNRK